MLPQPTQDRPPETQCPACGSTEILYGKKSGLCKACRLRIEKPETGWMKNGEPVRIRVATCKCGKVFSKGDKCPVCGATDFEEETW